ncbi:thioredoxin [Bacillus sp. HMF5848]|uniref:thioredoxin family protein n=1 Tax=Bacillus sp. HMF5848 TaxID=2495421 RepID=UPI000F778002|nr:thioredoxin family protein [Bacillus sp. HMF5848]RSK26224.1 thioredoxin [Bacillus sp. HMF5848]
MKKIIIFSAIVVGLFLALFLLTNYQQQQQAQGNPFGKETLHPETLKQLDDPNYQNVILPDELESALNKNETVSVYFYSPTCPACVKTAPILVPLAEDMGIDLKMFNVLEFPEAWDTYGLEGTPTLIHFVDGQEANRTVGYAEEDVFEAWLNENVLE